MNSNNGDDPLDALFVRGDAIDKKLLAQVLAPYVKIYQDTGIPEIVLTPEADKLTVPKKLLVYLLARKAIKLRNTELIEREGMTPGELEKATGIAGGTIRPSLRKLLDTRLVQVDKSADGAYFVPNYSIRSVSKEVLGEGEA